MANYDIKNYDFETELSKFQSATEDGHQIATQKYEEIAFTLRRAEKRIKDAQQEKNQMSQIQTATLLKKQDEELLEIRKYIAEIRINIDAMYDGQKNFSIAVFGRTGSGKSTLMEILTHGDGQTIGAAEKGESRDIRSYFWKGLKIIDVPGIDFFDSSEKDLRGMETAKNADLVVFLITNDEPRPEEAQCLAQLKILSKPILVVVNVKKNLRSKKSETIVKELQKILEDKEVEDVVKNFKSLAKDYNQEWDDLKFVPVHLLSAYNFSNEKKNDAEIYAASNFPQVENFILEKVQTEGQFLRVKNFVDTVSVTMNHIIFKLFEHSAASLKESTFWLAKYRAVNEWRQSYWESAQVKIHNLYSELSDNLKYEAQHFAEENYNIDEKYDLDALNEKWRQHIKQFGYVERHHELLKTFAQECETQLKKFGSELTQELKISFDGKTQTNFTLDSDTDWEDYAKLLPNLLIFLPGIGWTARIAIVAATAIFHSWFTKKEKKITAAKENLRTQIEKASIEELSKISNKARDILNKQIFGKVEDFSGMLRDYSYMLAKLGAAQSELAETLIGEYSDLNEIIFARAVKYQNAGDISEVRLTTRIPGELSMILIEDPTVNTEAVSELLGEKFLAIQPLDNWKDTLKKILGCDFELISYATGNSVEDKIYSIKPKDEVKQINLKLAQQVSPYPIIA